MDNLDLKFTIPPAVFVLLIFLANPSANFLSNGAEIDSQIGGVNLLVGGAIVLLGVGFILTSIAYTILMLYGLHYPPNDRDAKGEFLEWKILEGRKELWPRVRRRWGMVVTNLSCFIATISSGIFIFYFRITPIVDYWTPIWLICLLVFFYNFLCTKHDVETIRGAIWNDSNTAAVTGD